MYDILLLLPLLFVHEALAGMMGIAQAGPFADASKNREKELVCSVYINQSIYIYICKH